MSANTQNLSIVLSATDNASSVIKGVWNNTKNAIDWVNSKLQSTKPTFEKMAGYGTVAFAWIGYAIKNLTNDASNLVEINQKFGVVYSEMSDKADKTASDLASSYWLAKSGARGYLADIGDLVSGLWYTQEASLDFGNTVISLGTDLASFSNVAGGSEEAIDRLKKGLLWEHENLKALGIQINEEMVNTQLLADGTENLTWKALMQAKVQARLTLAMDQSKNAIWDYARSSDSLANRTREMQARTQDLKDTLWNAFYPIILQITNAVIPLLQKFWEWAGKNEELVKVIGITAISIAGVVAVIGTIWLILLVRVARLGIIKLAHAFLYVVLYQIAFNKLWVVVFQVAHGLRLHRILAFHILK